MKKKSKDERADEHRAEYDLRELLKEGVQGKYAERSSEGTNLVLLDQDVTEAFPTDEAVNETLRLVVQLRNLPKPGKKTKTKEASKSI